MSSEKNFVPESEALRTQLNRNYFVNFSKLDEMRKWKPHEKTEGTAFFPVGDGIIKHGEKSAKGFPPKGSIMVLGQDFSNEVYLTKLLSNNKLEGETKDSPTWGNIEKWFWGNKKFPHDESAKIPLECCFFTNIYMGIRPGKTSMIGAVFKKKPDSEIIEKYKEESFRFLIDSSFRLREQIRVQEPKLIICLGKEVLNFLNLNIPSLNWRKGKSFKCLDENGLLFRKDIVFGSNNEFKTNFAALIHPSAKRHNINNFAFKENKLGEDSIIAFLKFAIKQSQVKCNL